MSGRDCLTLNLISIQDPPHDSRDDGQRSATAFIDARIPISVYYELLYHPQLHSFIHMDIVLC